MTHRGASRFNVASIALGAKFTLIGRAYLYGLMAGGRQGVDRTIAILRSEIERTMKLLGVASLAELEPQHVTQLQRLVPAGSPGVPTVPARTRRPTAGAAGNPPAAKIPTRVGAADGSRGANPAPPDIEVTGD